jgi:hypothetical protein
MHNREEEGKGVAGNRKKMSTVFNSLSGFVERLDSALSLCINLVVYTSLYLDYKAETMII